MGHKKYQVLIEHYGMLTADWPKPSVYPHKILTEVELEADHIKITPNNNLSVFIADEAVMTYNARSWVSVKLLPDS